MFASVALGLFLTVTDQSGVNIALPRIAEHFGADLPSAQWIALGFTLSTSVMFMPVGRLSDIFGRTHVFMLGFGVFVVAAAIGGTAIAFPVLIAAKIIQGIGVAGIEANGMAMVADIFPEKERGKAIGLYMSIIGAGAVGGPCHRRDSGEPAWMAVYIRVELVRGYCRFGACFAGLAERHRRAGRGYQ